MGCFSYSCQLSGLPITCGDAAVLIPLLPSKNNYYDNSESHIRQFGTASYCSNDGDGLFFRTAMLPIFGKYNDYGGLEEIREDDNTKTIEKYFDLTIQEVVNIICCGRTDDGYDDCLAKIKEDGEDVYGKPRYKERYNLLVKMSATWIRGEVYDGLIKNKRENYYPPTGFGNTILLDALGFEYIGDCVDDRYTKQYKKGELILKSDGSYLKSSIYSIPDFIKLCEGKGVEIDESILYDKDSSFMFKYIIPMCKSLKNTSSLENLIDYLDTLSNDETTEMLLPENAERHMLLRQQFKDLHSENISGELKRRLRNLFFITNEYDTDDQVINYFYFDEVKSNGGVFLKDNFQDWHLVKSYYFPTGRYLQPIGTSPQCGDCESVKILIDVAKSVIDFDVANCDSDGLFFNEN